ncbi:MAG TPA: hypothetical protein PK624_03590 [Spirochaetota bacterium]|nr:hypothetical protein [Spirochaetota bacterium]HPK55973.1 hypothetical protein [Spirochaetota bacterium]
MDYFFQHKSATKLSIHKRDNARTFIYPIYGIVLEEDIKIGKVTFVSKNSLNGELPISPIFKNDVFAKVVITDSVAHKLGNNSLSLKYLKETIGFIFVLNYLEQTKWVLNESKIVISNEKIWTLDEGLIVHYSKDADGYKLKNTYLISHDFSFYLNKRKLIKYDKWLKLLSKDETTRTQLEMKICKSLECIFHIVNDTNASNRMTNYFILLNHIFRVDSETDLDINGINQFINYLFSVKSKQDFFKAGKKNSTGLQEIYTRCRNNIQHGIIPSEEEFALVNEDDMISLKKVIFETLILFVSDMEISSLNNSRELFELMTKSFRKK